MYLGGYFMMLFYIRDKVDFGKGKILKYKIYI